jgi:hypothetical protein
MAAQQRSGSTSTNTNLVLGMVARANRANLSQGLETRTSAAKGQVRSYASIVSTTLSPRQF